MKKLALTIAAVAALLFPIGAVDGHTVHTNASHRSIDWD